MKVLGLPVSGHVAQRDELKELGKRTRTVPIPKALQKGGVETAEVKVKECMAVPQPYGALRLAGQDIAGDAPSSRQASSRWLWTAAIERWTGSSQKR